jgi:hypothetical protein
VPGAHDDTAIKLVIDGKRQAVQGPSSCSGHSHGLALSAGDAPNDVFIRLIPWNQPLLVGEISFGSGFTGVELEYDGKADGSDVTSDRIEDGDAHRVLYKIHGDAVVKNTADTKPFDLEITCYQ